MRTVKLTPQQFLAQWEDASHTLEVNIHNFEVRAGKAAVNVFKGSFDKQRLNTESSSAWKPLTEAWRKKSKRGSGPILKETGALRSSIKVKSIKAHQVTIHTDPSAFASRPKRHKGFCYAKVHNNFDSLPTKPLRGPKHQRQFIGHSTILREKLNELSRLIFKDILK